MRYAPWIVYNHRAFTPDPPGAHVNVPSARQTWLTEHQSGRPVTARLTCPCKPLRLSGLAITQYYVRHMEWGFYSVKCQTGGGGGSTWLYDGDGDA